MHFLRYTPAWLFTLAALGSCSKLGPDESQGMTVVAGQVVDGSNGQPLANAQVGVWGFYSSGSLGGGGGYSALGAPHLADAQGRFSFQFEAAKGTAYTLRAFRAPGYVTNWGTDVNVNNGQANNNLRVPVQAPAWLRFVIVDEPPKSRVWLDVYGYGQGFRLNHPRDTVLVRPMDSNLASKVIWIIKDERGVDTQYSKDILVSSLDTLTVRIPF